MMMLSTFTNSALVVLVAALVSTTTSAESIGLRNFIEEQPAVGTSCMSDADCGPSPWDYCKFDLGSCGEDGEPGECARATPACTRDMQPVCKCDGNTAGNPCAAGAVSIRHEGQCASEPEPEPEPEPENRSAGVGDTCTSNDHCFPPSANMYCQFPVGSCGEDGQSGVCTMATHRCARNFDWACTCDGNTASNHCTAGANSLRSEGKCPEPEPEPQTDPQRAEPDSDPSGASSDGGCSSNEDCESREFCKKADGDCDGVGKCRLALFRANSSVEPVCGCDGNWYANPSAANAQGESVATVANSPTDCPGRRPNIIDTAIE